MMWREIEGSDTGDRDAPAVVTVGNFDGVHRGHQDVLRVAKERCAGLPLVAVTFDPHPLAVVRPEQLRPALTTLERRIELLHEHGADEVRVLAFDSEVAAWSPEEFVDRVLVERLRADTVVVGENFRFGHKNSGDIDLLGVIGDARGFDVVPVPLAGDAQAYSSTRVRELLESGDVASAADILGRPHEVVGIVVEGDKRGRELGFPTANVPLGDASAAPGDGVYACWLVADGVRHAAATSVGTNPTFEGTERRVESFVIDHPTNDLDLYGVRVRVEFVEHLRPMERFDSVDALVSQIHDDVTDTREALRR
jgi:riboflavin kinase/FMN adenylyltransferase